MTRRTPIRDTIGDVAGLLALMLLFYVGWGFAAAWEAENTPVILVEVRHEQY